MKKIDVQDVDKNPNVNIGICIRIKFPFLLYLFHNGLWTSICFGTHVTSMIMMKFQLSDYEQCLKQFTWDYRTFISDTEPIFIFPLFLFARSQERINIGLSWSYGNKTFEHEFVLILEKKQPIRRVHQTNTLFWLDNFGLVSFMTISSIIQSFFKFMNKI
jgi:hypothetical protein